MKLFKIVITLFILAIFFNACKKEYSVQNFGTNAPVGSWQFLNGNSPYTGNIDSAYIDTISPTTKELHLDGVSTDGTQNFYLILYADSFTVGAYKASLFQNTFDLLTTTGKNIYQANQLIGEFIVNITTITKSVILGTFSGTAKDSAGTAIQLTSGKFEATFPNAVPPSTGVLGDSSGNCKPVVLNGTYTQGITATAANTVQAQVVVAVAGTYTISTNTVNGITFSGTGTFTNPGVQNVILTASGVPVASGGQNFVLSYGNSQCGFTVNFLAGVTASGDYFPLTLNSNWTYNLVGVSPSQSVFQQVINYSPNFSGTNYQTIAFYNVPVGAAVDSFYYFKPGGNYDEYINYSTRFGFDQPVSGEFIFLKDNVPVNTTWQSPTISGTVLGVTVSGYVTMTLLAKAVPVTVGTFNFPDVIEVGYQYFLTGNSTAVLTQERWFAKDQGEIYNSTTKGTTTTQYQVSQYIIY